MLKGWRSQDREVRHENKEENYEWTTCNGKVFWNKGYNTETLNVMEPYGKEVLSEKRLTAYVVSDHKGSYKIFNKNDFNTLLDKNEGM